MNRSSVLIVDALISFVLGAVLAVFPKSLIDLLGLPATEATFYPRLLGAVVIGIAIALVYECRRSANERSGLGLGGAIAIDLSAAAFLGCWLIFSWMTLPLRGALVLGSVTTLLISVSVLGFVAQRQKASQ